MEPTQTRKADPGFLDYIGNLGTAIGSVFNDPIQAVTGPPIVKKKHYKQSQNYIDHYSGKFVIVTGATGDIGSKICRKLFKAGVTHLVMFCRQEDKFNPKTRKALYGK